MTEHPSISALLGRLEGSHGVEILYACESGSRAWGFASPDSDYDIRFVFRRPADAALGTEVLPETIEHPLEDNLDAAGWDIRKSLRLLRKSNGALIEWLHSPVVYRAEAGFAEAMRRLVAEHFSPRLLAGHYRGMAARIHRERLDSPAPSAKAYLYCLRAILAARHIIEFGTPPPVPFRDLMDLAPEADVLPAIREILDWKSRAGERDSAGAAPVLDSFIERSLPELERRIGEVPDSLPPPEPFDAVLRRWSGWSSPFAGPRMKKADFTLERVRRPEFLLFECIAGSRAFGTHHEGSDVDLRGVFAVPPRFLCGLESIEQVNDAKGDIVYYELGRFVALLASNNPNLIELLFTPRDCIRFRHPAFELLSPEIFLSKLCRQTFGNYAMGQIRKARGLNKKIVNPEPETRRHLREFCHVLEGQGSVPLADWLAARGWREEDCGLVAARHAPGVYAVFHDPTGGSLGYRGIFSKKDDASLLFSPVPKGAEPVAWMHCNLDAFKAHCKAHREYWQWVKRRNEDRFLTNIAHGRGYDSKNLMHTLRLLDQAIEIARDHRITLPRPNARWLGKVKSGAFDYEELLGIAEEKHLEMLEAFETSSLPETPSREKINEVLLAVREEFFGGMKGRAR